MPFGDVRVAKPAPTPVKKTIRVKAKPMAPACDEIKIRLKVLRQRITNLKMHGKTGILQEIDEMLGL